MTIRPLGGITDKTIEATKNWLNKQHGHFSVIEKQDEARHLHAQIWLEHPIARGQVCTSLQRICERTIDEWTESQKKVLRNGVRIAYSDWYSSYLSDNETKTGDEKGITLTDSPPDMTLDYYPTEAEQVATQALTNAVDKTLFKYEQQFIEWTTQEPPYPKYLIATWLANQMFVDRNIQVIRDPRLRRNLCISLHSYINKICDPTLFLGEKWFMENESLTPAQP